MNALPIEVEDQVRDVEYSYFVIEVYRHYPKIKGSHYRKQDWYQWEDLNWDPKHYESLEQAQEVVNDPSFSYEKYRIMLRTSKLIIDKS
jgi:hypothetical protein